MKRILFILTTLAFIPSLYAVPENSEARGVMREVITAPTQDVLKAKSGYIDQVSDGSEVMFRVEQQNDSFYLLFLNRVDGRFPVYGKGAYIIKRNLDDGKFVQIKVFLKTDPGCYARIYPLAERTMMEIFLYGKRVYTDINLPFEFSDLLQAPFSEIMDSTGAIVDWDLVFPPGDGYLYADKRALSAAIRADLPNLGDADDGAMDADGKYVFIESLKAQPAGSEGFNCSGFVKWVADGLFWGKYGRYMSVAELKSKHLDERGNRWSARHEDERDPYFGLDWTRNIAVSIEGDDNGREAGYKSADVTDVPWSSYTEDIGFPIGDLELVMYYLAVREPYNIYLASVNVPWGSEPVLQQHVHTVVLVPQIDPDGGFRDVIFERNFESRPDSLVKRYPDAHIHLVRIKVPAKFRLPETEHKPGLGPDNFFRR